jgi:hypothetical protein
MKQFKKKKTSKIITEVINVLHFRNQIVTISNSLEISKILFNIKSSYFINKLLCRNGQNKTFRSY